MRYWWVNQNQTFRHEIAGRYLWSPKRNKGNRLNPFYETMREVAPGDVIFRSLTPELQRLELLSPTAGKVPNR